jgi:hypothetical protein
MALSECGYNETLVGVIFLNGIRGSILRVAVVVTIFNVGLVLVSSRSSSGQNILLLIGNIDIQSRAVRQTSWW